MSLKVYLHYEEAGCPEKTSKLSLPKSWPAKKSVVDVIDLFTGAYNKANPDNAIVNENVHLETKEAVKLYSNVLIEGVLEDRYDYFIRPGAHVKPAAVVQSNNDGKVRCKNYGCNQMFFEDANTDDHACSHHKGPPIFHDAAKYWSCCPDRKVYDWEDFQKLPGCATSCHSTVDPKVALGSSHAPDADPSSLPTPPALKSISSYNDANPHGASAATEAVKLLSTAERKSTRQADGTAKCKNKGCGKVFQFDTENNATACRHHAGQPVFHDAIKYWSCCADKKCYDFDSFMLVPGCATGFHDDGVIELPELTSCSA